jgi:hypothetical protein
MERQNLAVISSFGFTLQSSACVKVTPSLPEQFDPIAVIVEIIRIVFEVLRPILDQIVLPLAEASSLKNFGESQCPWYSRLSLVYSCRLSRHKQSAKVQLLPFDNATGCTELLSDLLNLWYQENNRGLMLAFSVTSPGLNLIPSGVPTSSCNSLYKASQKR